MAGPHTDTDVLVVGGGPAGSAAAIWCLKHGLSVSLLERERFPRDRPGETLHPGIEVILRSLDVYEEVLQFTAVRHRGIYMRSSAGITFIPYGTDDRGEWRGFQVLRNQLDDCLLRKVLALGAKVHQPATVRNVIMEQGKVAGVTTAAGTFRARFVVDATGHVQWLRKMLNLRIEKRSQVLLARYGYTAQQDYEGEEPIFSFHDAGWSWNAKITDQLCQWTEVTVNGKFPVGRHADLIGKIKGADVTWRFVPECAGPGYFITGDAATILDPAASRGVLRAMYSGVMAADSIIRLSQSKCEEKLMIQRYKQWLQKWFDKDCEELRQLYWQKGINILD